MLFLGCLLSQVHRAWLSCDRSKDVSKDRTLGRLGWWGHARSAAEAALQLQEAGRVPRAGPVCGQPACTRAPWERERVHSFPDPHTAEALLVFQLHAMHVSCAFLHAYMLTEEHACLVKYCRELAH